MKAILKNESWDLIPKPKGLDRVSCKWIQIEKKPMVVWRDTMLDLLFGGSFKNKVKFMKKLLAGDEMISVRIVISLAACHGWKIWAKLTMTFARSSHWGTSQILIQSMHAN